MQGHMSHCKAKCFSMRNSEGSRWRHAKWHGRETPPEQNWAIKRDWKELFETLEPDQTQQGGENRLLIFVESGEQRPVTTLDAVGTRNCEDSSPKSPLAGARAGNLGHVTQALGLCVRLVTEDLEQTLALGSASLGCRASSEYLCYCCLVTQSCLITVGPMDCDHPRLLHVGLCWQEY